MNYEYKINEIFKFDNKYFKVIGNEKYNTFAKYQSCNNCYFLNLNCDFLICTQDQRIDNIDVVYRLVDIKKIRKLKLDKLNDIHI